MRRRHLSYRGGNAADEPGVEKIARRRGELWKMRELMFRAEIKVRRIGKTKSKAYSRTNLIEHENGRHSGISILENGLVKCEIRRVLMQIVGKMLRTCWLEVKNCVEGSKELVVMKVESEDNSNDGDNCLDVEGGLEKIKEDVFNELSKLDEAERIAGDENQKGKSIFEMKFMKNAMARQMQATNKLANDFIKEIGGNGESDSDNEGQDEFQVLDSSSGVLVKGQEGAPRTDLVKRLVLMLAYRYSCSH